VAQTYTSQWFRISNGAITTHNPQSLVPTPADIRILSADIQWEGIETSKTTTSTNTNSNSQDYTSISSTTTWSVNSPSQPAGSFEKAVAELNYAGPLPETAVDLSIAFGGETTQTTADAGQGAYLTITDTSGIPSKADFSWSPNSSTSNTAEVYSSVTVYTSETTTTYYDTTDPRATRDVLGESGGITLTDGERSSWFALDSLEPDPEEFYHDIDGSGEARFRFRFDWEEKFPTALKQLRVYDADTDGIRTVALADPADSQLDYNAIRTAVGGTVYAIDVVDPSDPDAISSHRIQHPTHGTLCPRASGTVSV